MDLSDKTVLVAGLGISGRSMMEVLRSRAARVIGVDEHKPEADLHSFDDIDWDSADIDATITKIVKESGIFTVDFSEVPGFIPAVAGYVRDIEALGMEDVLAKFLKN